MFNFEKLDVWQKAIALADVIYSDTRSFPADERFGLTNQMRRSVISVPSNIAEGKGRYSQRDFLHFLLQARGSINEVETQLLLAQDLDYLPEEQTNQLLAQSKELGKILNGLISSLRKTTESTN